MSAPSIYLSNHAKDRLRERHDKHLLRYTNLKEFNTSCYELLDLATFTNRHLNDQAFMVRMHEKYGYDGVFRFKEYKNVLFIIVDELVVTVLDSDAHGTTSQHGRVKRY
jgi:hypothetical protein